MVARSDPKVTAVEALVSLLNVTAIAPGNLKRNRVYQQHDSNMDAAEDCLVEYGMVGLEEE